MPTVPLFAILACAGALGATNLAFRLRGKRKENWLTLHLLFGIGALAMVVFLLKDFNGGEGVSAGAYGNIAAGLLALAVFIGLVSPIVAKDSRALSNILLVAHIASGLSGVLTAAFWISSF
jgi:hypothetical protein